MGPARPLALLALLALGLGTLALGWRAERRHEVPDRGRPADAFGPLERAVRAEFDPEVLLLLAHLYDYREDPSRAIARLEAVLEREPAHAEALRLLEKIAREWRAEAGFHRDVTPRFVLKYRGAPGEDARRTILGLLEVAAERVGRALHWEPR